MTRNTNYNNQPEVKEFEEKVIRVSRVSKKTKGGNRMGFSVVVVVGDRKGRVGVGLGKATDVQSSIQKGVTYAKKHLIQVPMINSTIPHEVYIKLGAARILLKPASPGTGVIAGGAVRAVVEAAGIKDILSKVLGTNNKASNVYAALAALQTLTPRAPSLAEVITPTVVNTLAEPIKTEAPTKKKTSPKKTVATKEKAL